MILPGKFAGSAEMIKAINTKGHLFPPTPTWTTGRRDLPSPMSWCRHEPGKGVEVGFGWLFLRLTNMGTWKSPIWKRELIYTNLHCVGEPMLVVFAWNLEVGIGRFVACVLRKYYEFVKDEWRCSISICHIVDSCRFNVCCLIFYCISCILLQQKMQAFQSKKAVGRWLIEVGLKLTWFQNPAGVWTCICWRWFFATIFIKVNYQ